MKTLGATVLHVAPGAVELAVPAAPTLLQHDGLFHAGVTITLSDSAAGLAALTLFEPGAGVLTVRYRGAHALNLAE